MCVLRRMDAVLEPTKQAVLDIKQMLDDARITEQRAALADAAGQAFYNTSRFTLRDLKSRGNPPYGKSWKKDLEAMGGKDGMRDPRFKVMHNDEELSLSLAPAMGSFSSWPTWSAR